MCAYVFMKCPPHFSLLTKAAFGFLPALVLSISLPCSANVPTPPAPPPTPAGYCQTINTELTNDLNAFNATLSSVWNGSTYPTVYAGNLTSANGNVGPGLTNSTQMTAVVNQLQVLQAMGHTAIMIEMGFPLLYQPFYSSQSQYQSYLTFYTQLAQTIHGMGMQVIVENDVLLSSDMQAGWTNTAAFYATLNWTQYQAARAQMAATVAQFVQPDYLVLGEEPDSESFQAAQPNVNIPGDAAAMIGGEIAAVQALNLSSPPLMGAGFGSWVANLNQYISDYVALPLDYIDFHVYAINTENGTSLIGNALTIASAAAAAGKPVAMSETWLWKMEDSEWLVLTPDQYRAREPFSFWAPENTLFLQTMQNLANYTQMLYQAPSEPYYFVAYQTYGGTTANGGAANCTCTTASCTGGTIINTETSLATTANAQSVYTTTGISYYNLLVSPADTVPPSQPLSLTGTVASTTVNLSWAASTDNIGVAGYNVIRNGVWITNSGDTAFQDTGLATSTTYNYQVQAFDLAGNTSVASPTLSLSTVYTIPPTAPTSVMASPYSTTGITVSWSASQDPKGVNSYKIFRGASPSGLVQVATVQGTTVSYTDRNLAASTTYYYGVEATQASYVSAMSSVISGTTLPMPNAPTNLAASATSGTKLSLSWSETVPPQGLPISSYQVYCGLTSSNLSKIATTSNASYTYGGLTAGNTYYCAVLASDTGGDLSVLSTPVAGTTDALPNAPTNVVAAVNTSTRLTVTWSETVAPGGLSIGEYQIFRGTSPGNLTQVATRATASYVDTTVSAAQTYYYAIEAQDTGNDVSAMSVTSAGIVP